MAFITKRNWSYCCLHNISRRLRSRLAWKPSYVHEEKSIVQFCSSNGKYLTSMAHELRKMTIDSHVTFPSDVTMSSRRRDVIVTSPYWRHDDVRADRRLVRRDVRAATTPYTSHATQRSVLQLHDQDRDQDHRVQTWGPIYKISYDSLTIILR